MNLSHASTYEPSTHDSLADAVTKTQGTRTPYKEMATSYSGLNYNTTNNHLPFYNPQQQPSPTDTAPPTPHNISPTSPRMDMCTKFQVPNHVRQLRPPKTPLYVPAALRPTERPVRQSPMTPPKSLYGSLDNLEEAGFDETLDPGGVPPFDIAFPEESLGEVTGPPNKDHWKPDEASPSCDSPKCRSFFNLFVRKHHCRHCGHIFCSEHTAYTIPLDQRAKFHPDGVQSRACDSCYLQYQKWNTARRLRRDTGENSNTDDSGSATPPGGSDNKPLGHRSVNSQQMPSEPVASSVPRDWAWSTF